MKRPRKDYRQKVESTTITGSSYIADAQGQRIIHKNGVIEWIDGPYETKRQDNPESTIAPATGPHNLRGKAQNGKKF
jgi:hypothetical protein